MSYIREESGEKWENVKTIEERENITSLVANRCVDPEFESIAWAVIENDRVYGASYEDITVVKEIGEEMASSIAEYGKGQIAILAEERIQIRDFENIEKTFDTRTGTNCIASSMDKIIMLK